MDANWRMRKGLAGVGSFFAKYLKLVCDEIYNIRVGKKVSVLFL